MRGRWLFLVPALLGACLSRPPAAAGGAAAEGPCPLAVSGATVWLHGAEREGGKIERVEVAPVFLQRRPAAGTAALVVPYPRGEAVRLRVVATERQEDGPAWHVRLEDAKATPLVRLPPGEGRRPEAPSDAVVLWPAPDAEVRLSTPAPADLPPEVSPAIVKAALDLDGDGQADVLLAEFCCGQRRTRTDCEYFCGETWQRVKGRWARCSAWQPA